jgi:hypothetical protein
MFSDYLAGASVFYLCPLYPQKRTFTGVSGFVPMADIASLRLDDRQIGRLGTLSISGKNFVVVRSRGN